MANLVFPKQVRVGRTPGPQPTPWSACCRLYEPDFVSEERVHPALPEGEERRYKERPSRSIMGAGSP
jgi:hypothetical protein